jgi:hypothetical protein
MIEDAWRLNPDEQHLLEVEVHALDELCRQLQAAESVRPWISGWDVRL